jgi:hypothetical protein
MSKDNVSPVIGSPFEQIVTDAQWHDEAILQRLRVASSGWLTLVNEQGTPDELVGFSVENVTADSITPPANLDDVRQRLGHVTAGLFNTDMTAKGIGSKISNAPQTLQPHSIPESGVAIRALPFNESMPTAVRREPDGVVGQKLRLLRHGSLLAASILTDKLTRSDRGTERAMAFMERRYGDALLVDMPVPPVWLLQQRQLGVTHPLQPQVKLVRGGAFAERNRMRTIGLYPVQRS